MSSLSDIRRIREFAASKGWKKSRLAKEAGVGDTTLRGFDRDDWNPTARVLERLTGIIPKDFRASKDVAQ